MINFFDRPSPNFKIMIRNLFFLTIILFVSFNCRIGNSNIDDSIHIRLKKDPERIHPLIFPNPIAREVYQYIFLPLADYNPETLELSPVLLKNIPLPEKIDTGKYAGGIKYHMELLDDAKWDNGSPVTGYDYAFTVKSVLIPLTNAARYRENMQHIKDVVVNQEKPGHFDVIYAQDYLLSLETAVTFELYPQYFYDPEKLSENVSFDDLNNKYVDELSRDSMLIKFAELFNGNEFSRNKISGCGPYTFENWESEQYISLSKKQNYWGNSMDRPNFKNGPDKIIFHIIPDDVTALSQLKEGNIDVMNEMTGSDFEDLRNDINYKDKFNFFTPLLMKTYIINLNNRDIKLEDKNVRKALACLVDVDAIIENVEGGHGLRLTGSVHPSKRTINKALKPIEFNPEKAGQLLSDAGWTDSDGNGIRDKKINNKKIELELDIYISGQELGKRLALMLQEAGKSNGIKFNIIEKEFKLIRAENLKKRNYHLVPTVISQDLNLWDDLSGRWHSRNDTPEGANDMSYRNPVCDALIDSIAVSANENERMQLYQRLQEVIYEDQPVIFLYAPAEKIVINKKWLATATVKRPGYMANTFKLIVDGVPISN